MGLRRIPGKDPAPRQPKRAHINALLELGQRGVRSLQADRHPTLGPKGALVLRHNPSPTKGGHHSKLQEYHRINVLALLKISFCDGDQRRRGRDPE